MRILLVLLIFFAYGINAKTEGVTIYAAKISPITLINESGDHIYFSINEFPSVGTAKLLRVPDYPDNWESRILPCMKDIKIWEGEITDENGVVVVLSMLDQAFPLFEDERLIGNIMIEINNNGQEIIANWAAPDFYDQPKVEQIRLNEPKYIMFGSTSQYMVEFKVRVHNR